MSCRFGLALDGIPSHLANSAASSQADNYDFYNAWCNVDRFIKLAQMPEKKRWGRAVLRIEVSPHAVAVITDIKETLGLTEIAITSKLIEWLAQQPDEIKMGVLGIFPDLAKEEAATLYLKKLAANSR